MTPRTPARNPPPPDGGAEAFDALGEVCRMDGRFAEAPSSGYGVKQ
jgi:hypothetical protein